MVQFRLETSIYVKNICETVYKRIVKMAVKSNRVTIPFSDRQALDDFNSDLCLYTNKIRFIIYIDRLAVVRELGVSAHFWKFLMNSYN